MSEIPRVGLASWLLRPGERRPWPTTRIALRDHVTLTCRSVDRIFLQAWLPNAAVGGRGVPVPVLAEGDQDPVLGGVRQDRRRLCRRGTSVGQGRRDAGAPVRQGENKEEIARPLIEAAERDGGDGRVVLIGIAQEKTPIWR